MSECECKACQSLCLNPGWFTPEQAMSAIEAGLASSMMLDWTGDRGDDRTFVLCPASNGCQGSRAPNTEELFSDCSIFTLPTKGKCVFFKEERCTIHNSGFKPKQCVDSLGCCNVFTNNTVMGELWDTDSGRAAVESWMNLVGFDQYKLNECD